MLMGFVSFDFPDPPNAKAKREIRAMGTINVRITALLSCIINFKSLIASFNIF
jgi:hypothetical protein